MGNSTDLGVVDGTAALTTEVTAGEFAHTITHPDRDFFEFDAGADGEVSVRITMPDGTGYPFGPNGLEPTNLGVRVRDAAGVIIATSNGTADNIDIASFDATNGETYFAEVYSGSFGQVNAYNLSVSIVDKPLGRITGFVFEDKNQDTLRDRLQEDLLAGQSVSLDVGNDGGATADITVTTDANGYYEFENVPFSTSTHRVYLSPSAGFHTVYPDASTNFAYLINVSEDNLNLDHIDFATVEADFGDAPISYGTLLANNGPRHAIGSLILGAEIDAEADGFDSTVTSDDATNTGSTDDEDGVTFTTSIIENTNASVDVVSTGTGLLNAWIDFDGDGSFATTEQIFTNEPVAAGTNSLPFAVPGSLTAGTTYARFRLSTEADLTPHGPAADGEV